MPFSSDSSIKYLRCALDDDPKCDIAAHFEESLAFITEAKARGSRVVVHCKQGMRFVAFKPSRFDNCLPSRSATIVILWLMTTRKISLKAATDYCRSCRPFINTNPGFLKQLGLYELSLFGTTTIRFPDEPLTIKTVYEWLYPDGKWIPRVVVTDASQDQ